MDIVVRFDSKAFWYTVQFEVSAVEHYVMAVTFNFFIIFQE